MSRLLIIGGSSFIGRYLIKHFSKENTYCSTYHQTSFPNSIKFDATQDRLPSMIKNLKSFSHAIILLGETNPDVCVKDIITSDQINVVAIRQIIDDLVIAGVIPVFMSSEAVFDGEKSFYNESDTTNPLLLYARQKMLIETYIQRVCDHYLIVRLGRIFASQLNDATLLTGLFKHILDNTPIRIAIDHVFSPLHVSEVINGLLLLINKKQHGIFHLAGPQAVNRANLFDLLLRTYQKQGGKYLGKVSYCSIDDFNTIEPRPKNISLDIEKITRHTELKLLTAEQWCYKVVLNART